MHHDPEITSYLFEHARDIILVLDGDTGRILDANAAAEVAYGYTRDELLTLTIYDLRVEPSTEVSEQMKAAQAAGILFETAHRRRDGSTFPVEVSARGDVITGRRAVQHHPRHVRPEALRGRARGAARRHPARAPAPR